MSAEDECFKDRRPCWLLWVILPSGHTALRAVCLSKAVADRYETYIKETQKVERVMVEESRTNHLYFGAFDKGQTVDPKDVLAALARARTEFAKTGRKRKKKLDLTLCGATIYHGPGHQSKSQCEMRGPHTQHSAIDELYWSTKKAFSGYFDQSPEFRGEPQRKKLAVVRRKK